VAMGDGGGWAGAGHGCSGSGVCWAGCRAGMGGRAVHLSLCQETGETRSCDNEWWTLVVEFKEFDFGSRDDCLGVPKYISISTA